MARGRQASKVGRGKVVWSAAVSSKPVEQHQTRRPHSPRAQDVPGHLVDHMIVGSLWCNDLQLTINAGYFCRPGYYSASQFPKGTLFIYAGTERVEESYGERKISLIRHMFIANGVKGIVDGIAFNYMSPIEV